MGGEQLQHPIAVDEKNQPIYSSQLITFDAVPTSPTTRKRSSSLPISLREQFSTNPSNSRKRRTSPPPLLRKPNKNLFINNSLLESFHSNAANEEENSTQTSSTNLLYHSIHLLEKKQSNALYEVISAISSVKSIMKQWSWAEMTVGLDYYIKAKKKEIKQHQPTIDNQFILESVEQWDLFYKTKEEQEIETLFLQWRRFALLTFSVFRYKSLEQICDKTNLKMEHIITCDTSKLTMRPGYFICVDEETQCILMIFRGTKCFADLVTDLNCKPVSFQGNYFCHQGMLQGAEWFCQNQFIKELLFNLMKKYPTYGLKLLGHSLGAATAALVTMLWRRDFPMIESVGFATPCIISLDIAVSCCNYITSFINENDLVPRLSIRSIEKLRNNVNTYPWKNDLKKDIQNTVLIKAASNAGSFLKTMASEIFQKGKKWIQRKQLEEMDVSEEFQLVEHACSEPNSPTNSHPSQFEEEEEVNLKSSVDEKNHAISMNSPQQLFPPGRVYQMRSIDEIVYLKRCFQADFSTLEISETWKQDHRMLFHLEKLNNFYYQYQSTKKSRQSSLNMTDIKFDLAEYEGQEDEEEEV